MKIGKIRINMIEDKSYQDKKNAVANVGESLQAVAMEYIFDNLGIDRKDIVKVDQCGLKEYKGEELIFPLRLPLSKDTVDSFLPLPDKIKPIFMSLHLHDDIFDGRDDLIEYFQKYVPIGCRDEQTCDFFLRHGIEAYMMGCYTVCFPRREKMPRNGKVFMVDVSNELERCIPDSLKEKAVVLSHAVPFATYPVTHEEDERLVDVARNYLARYRDEAKLVITSRLHVASPCMAMGIPVILASDNIDFRYAWIDKYFKLYQIDEYSRINWEPETVDASEVKELLFGFYRESIQTGYPAKEYLKKLDAFYRKRTKTEYYQCFRNRILKLRENYGSDDIFSYAIWGAGFHAIFAHDLMSELFPNARLRVIIDKYKTGNMFQVPIIKAEELDEYKVDHICITTNPGMQEAMLKCKELFGEDLCYRYTLITSQQKS